MESRTLNSRHRFTDRARIVRSRPGSSTPHGFRRTSRSTKTRSPTAQRTPPACIKSIRLPKQAQVSSVSFQAQYQAFVRFAVGSSAALSAIALDWTCVLEPFTRRALVSRTLASPVTSYGASNPGPMLWAERSRSRGIFQAVFLRPNRTLSGLFLASDGPRNARQIGFGGPCRR